MNLIKSILISFFFIYISTTDYHGYLYDINGEYLKGDFPLMNQSFLWMLVNLNQIN